MWRSDSHHRRHDRPHLVCLFLVTLIIVVATAISSSQGSVCNPQPETSLGEDLLASLPPDLDNRETLAEDVYVLSAASAYTITQYPDGAIVTKVWNKAGPGWRIVHLHESFSGKPPKPPES